MVPSHHEVILGNLALYRNNQIRVAVMEGQKVLPGGFEANLIR